MPLSEELITALETALITARAEYRNEVVQLATREAKAVAVPVREPTDVDRIHHARTRIIALDAAREELARMIDESAPLIDD